MRTLQIKNKNGKKCSKKSHFFQAAKRLDILLSDSANDVIAVDVFYYHSYCTKFLS